MESAPEPHLMFCSHLCLSLRINASAHQWDAATAHAVVYLFQQYGPLSQGEVDWLITIL